MIIRLVAAMWFLLLLVSETVVADTPDLEAMGKIQAGSKSLQVEEYSAPFVVDWNNDGSKDLVVGQYQWGFVWLYLNQGTNLNPAFDEGKKITWNGEPITTAFS
jgi:hypothetical protein